MSNVQPLSRTLKRGCQRNTAFPSLVFATSSVTYVKRVQKSSAQQKGSEVHLFLAKISKANAL